MMRLLSLTLLFFAYSAHVKAEVLSLSDALTRSYQRSEELLKADQSVLAAKARYDQAFALLFPTLNFVADQSFRDDANYGRLQRSSSSDSLDPVTNPNGGSSNIGRTQFDAGLTISQPIFNGFRDIIAAEAAKDEITSLEYSRERQKDLIANQVSELFFQILIYEDEITIYQAARKTLNQRVEELTEFAKLGRSKGSEVDASLAELARLEAQVEAANRALAISKETLAFYIGLPHEQINLEKNEIFPAPASLEQYLERAARRSDLLALEASLKGQQRLIEVARRESWPAINAESSSRLYEDPDRNRDWELMFRLQVPIFEGGRIEAKTREQAALARNVELELQQQRRVAERQVRVALAEHHFTKAELARLDALVAASKNNYEAQKNDYSLGVVNNLEVLQAIRQYQDAARQRSAASQRLNLSLVNIELAAGGYQE